MQRNLPGQDSVGTKEEAIANARRLLRYDPAAAAEQAREIIAHDDRSAESHRLLGMALRRTGQVEEARRAEDLAIRLSSLEQPLFQAAAWLAENRLDTAEHLIRPYLRQQPDDPVALRMLAEIGARTGNLEAAEALVKQALAVAPEYSLAKSLLTAICRVRERVGSLEGSARSTIGKEAFDPGDEPRSEQDDYREALELYREATTQNPANARNWMSYGHVLRVVGKRADAIDAYRSAIDARPTMGEAWWALADLKTKAFRDDDIATMTELLSSPDADASDRSALHFALAKAFEDRGEFARSFEHYEHGNRLRAASEKYDPDEVGRHVSKSIQRFDAGYFQERAGMGFEAPDPIFILGMPRAGSTLIEQVLSSHSSIEGTMELPDIQSLAMHLAGGRNAGLEDSNYLESLLALGPDDLRKLGQSYIWTTGLRRRTNRPLFVDKMPINWLHVGLILSILPNAKIIDARRHPLACGFSLYKQHFARGHSFSYDFTHIGKFYSDYVRMMRHFDKLLPGRIHRVIHEQLLEQPEHEIRSLLTYLDLPFEEGCLQSHDNKRVVRTASSEQVRRPINKEGVDQWRNFDPWLGELRQALGPIVDAYPGVPDEIG